MWRGIKLWSAITKSVYLIYHKYTQKHNEFEFFKPCLYYMALINYTVWAELIKVHEGPYTTSCI